MAGWQSSGRRQARPRARFGAKFGANFGLGQTCWSRMARFNARRGPGPASGSGPARYPGRFTDTDLRPCSMAWRASRPCERRTRLRAQLSELDPLTGERRRCAPATRACWQQPFDARRSAIHLPRDRHIPAMTDAIARRSAPERPHSTGKAHAKVWVASGFYRGYQGVGTGSWAALGGLLACLAGPLPLSG